MQLLSDHTKICDLTCAELGAFIDASVASAVQRHLPRATEQDFINSRACAHLVGVTPEHLCAMRSRGEGPPWSGRGKWIRYSKSEAIAWLKSLPLNERNPTRQDLHREEPP